MSTHVFANVRHFLCVSEANGVPRGRHGRGSVPRHLEKAKTVEHLQAPSLKVAQRKTACQQVPRQGDR